MSWFNLNDGLNNIKGQISSFASGVLTDVNEPDAISQDKRVQELEQEVRLLREQLSQEDKKSSSILENDIEEAWNWDSSTHDNKISDSENNSIIANLKSQIECLEKEKLELNDSLEQLDADCQRTTDKLITLKDALQTEHNELKLQFVDLKKAHDHLLNNDSKLKAEIERLKHENKKMSEEYKQIQLKNVMPDNSQLEKLTNEFFTLKESYNALQREHEHFKQSVQSESDYTKQENVALIKQNIHLLNKLIKLHSIAKSYEEMIKNNNISTPTLKESCEESLKELSEKNLQLAEKLKDTPKEIFRINSDESSLEIHETYLNIIKDSFKKFINYEIESIKGNDNIEEFKNVIETVIKFILDFKWKTETLEKEVVNLTQEKTNILTEKNDEIEKLLAHSKILTQEIIEKTETLKECETEVAELDKNNELLINELESFKSNSGLQTISESNEDNLLFLESQLDSSNKKIKELELTISDLENKDSNIEMQSELDYIKKQLNITGTELSQCKKKYKELLDMYNDVQARCNSLKESKVEAQNMYETCCDEKQELSNALDKIKTDYEALEYKNNELIVSLECFKEEAETIKSKLMEKLESEKIFLEKIDILECKLNKSEADREKYIAEINIINEKLENITKAELQYELVLKELNELKLNYSVALKQKEEAILQINELQQLVNCNDTDDVKTLNDLINKIKQDNVQLKSSELSKSKDLADITQKYEILAIEKGELAKKVEDLENRLNVSNKLTEKTDDIDNLKIKITDLENQLLQVHTSRNDLITLLTTKQAENVTYYQEIQRLTILLNGEQEKQQQIGSELENLRHARDQFMNEKQNIDETIKNISLLEKEIQEKNNMVEKISEQNTFLKEKCEVMAQNLLIEQSNTQKILSERSSSHEAETTLRKELERLKVHLLEIEETYTQELLSAQAKNNEMQMKVNEIEQREKNSSTMYTSISIRTNQQVETLHNQLQLVTNQRDELRSKISAAEDEISKQSAALTNLQFVLEQFQKEKETQIYQETERIRRQISEERQVQEHLRQEISALRAQLQESKEGLKAASRLSDQLETSKQHNSTLKDEVSKLQQKLANLESEHESIITQSDSKVDKTLIKNLVIGFVTTNNNFTKDQMQILKIISTVLDFSKQDNEKINLNRQQGSWIHSLLHPQSPAQNLSQESLSQAFVRFLENESKPINLPNLLDSSVSTSEKKPGASTTSSTQNTPILLSQVVLPTFSDFAHNRNSSSILKDVLKDNS